MRQWTFANNYVGSTALCIYILLIFCVDVLVNQSISACEVTIHSPSLDHSQWTVRDSTTATLRFTLTTTSPTCSRRSGSGRQLSKVSMGRVTSPLSFSPYCQILHKNGHCTNTFQGQCVCVTSGREYQFSVWVDRKMQGSTWSVRFGFSNGEQKTVEFTLDVRYPPRITGWTMESGNATEVNGALTAQRGSRVRVRCAWCQGNPARSAPLLSHHGNGRASSSSKVVALDNCEEIEHVIEHVTCSDSGWFRCGASWARNNRSELLLVEWGRRGDTVVDSGDDVTIQFPVRAHTSRVTQWTVTKVSARPTVFTNDLKARSTLNISGTPPNLTVTVTLRMVTPKDQGIWRLKLANEIGSGHVDFNVIVMDTRTTTHDYSYYERGGSKQESTPKPTGDDGNILTAEVGFVILGVIGCILVLIVFLIVIVAFHLKRRGERAGRDLAPPSPHGFQRRLEVVSRDLSERELPPPPQYWLSPLTSPPQSSWDDYSDYNAPVGGGSHEQEQNVTHGRSAYLHPVVSELERRPALQETDEAGYQYVP